MVNEKLRKQLDEYFREMELADEELPLMFDNHAYDNSIVGLTEDMRLVYDYNLMIEEFMKDEDCDESEAIEWIEYNTIRSLGYGEDRDRYPVILHNFKNNHMIGGD